MSRSAAMNIGVVGAGSWGTALAALLAKKGHQTVLWAYEPELVRTMAEQRVNDLYLPGVRLPDSLGFSGDLETTVAGKALVLLVAPSQVLRQVLRRALPALDGMAQLVCASKGIENGTLMTMSEVIEETVPEPLRRGMAFLSGPSFAKEVAAEMPTAVVAAAEGLEDARRVQEAFSTDYFRAYGSRDVIGVELGGALKNVIALAAGVSDGLGFGYNTRAALITRGLAEMSRIGAAKGADPSTFAGLAGMGDLVLTCTGDLSRNRSVGVELGRGKTLEEILAGMSMVAEGVKTTESAYQLARRLGVETPIIDQMYQILYEQKDPRLAVDDLMKRELKTEGP